MATARIALPVSVRAMISHSTSATTKTAREGNKPRQRNEGEAEIDAFEAVSEIDRAGVGVEGVEERVLDQHRQSQRHQQHVAVVAVRCRPDHKTLQAIAEREECRRDQKRGEIRIKPEFLEGEEGREQRGAQQRAMGEVDNVQHAINQRQPERDQRIDCAGHQAVDDGCEQYDGGEHAVIARQRAGPKRPARGQARRSNPEPAFTLPASGGRNERADCFVASLLAMTPIAQRQRSSSNA